MWFLKLRRIDLRRQHVARQIQLYRAHARRQRKPEGLTEKFWDAVCTWRSPGFLGDGCEQRLLVNFLKGVTILMLARQRPGNRDHRRERRLRLGKAGDKIGRPRAILASENNASTP